MIYIKMIYNKFILYKKFKKIKIIFIILYPIFLININLSTIIIDKKNKYK